MRRSKLRHESAWFNSRRRIIAAAATLVAFGAIVTVTQVSDAGTRRSTQRAMAACNELNAPQTPKSKLSTETRAGTWTTRSGRVTHHADDGSGAVLSTEQMRQNCRNTVLRSRQNNTGQNNTGQNNAGQNTGQQAGNNNGAQQAGNNAGAPPGAALGVLASSCVGSQQPPHDGFQKGDRCVSTSFGEVPAAANDASLLIVDSPEQVDVGQGFELKVSTRNLIRDRFLAAGQGGYYVESSLLQDGIVRGHFHTACRMLQNTDEAPDPAPVPAFFVATEDGKGGRNADTVSIQVAGMPDAGLAQCAVWAGDGSHRIPMMERANQTPAFDTVRINVN